MPPPGAPFTLARSLVPDTPGASTIKLSQLRIAPTFPPPPPKFNGRALIRSPLTLMPCSALSVFKIAASAVTLTVSAAVPTSSTAST